MTRQGVDDNSIVKKAVKYENIFSGSFVRLDVHFSSPVIFHVIGRPTTIWNLPSQAIFRTRRRINNTKKKIIRLALNCHTNAHYDFHTHERECEAENFSTHATIKNHARPFIHLFSQQQ